ncbi:uncharacterized protein LOC120171891 [Hibiscus syriacus]|uniref:uncharacterized protein LOC120171891 n=1 Tax=Hibiscus syriacus TaxID=106335 RepID=UPI0019240A53|nr:uncharacterized protein LOC120171891 [Hibiscus syriacus]
MENLFRQHDKEYMRMAMLKHEETFKQQVYELHRLYQIQKALMKSIESSRPNGSFIKKKNYHHGNTDMHHSSRTRLDLEYPAAEADHHQGYNVAEYNRGRLEAIDESEIELTLGLTKYTGRKKHGTLLTSDPSPSFSSSSSEFSQMTLRCQNGSINNNELEEQLRQKRLKQPPWLFQVLSMNMT